MNVSETMSFLSQNESDADCVCWNQTKEGYLYLFHCINPGASILSKSIGNKNSFITPVLHWNERMHDLPSK